jgi:hypothetical protein
VVAMEVPSCNAIQWIASYEDQHADEPHLICRDSWGRVI